MNKAIFLDRDGVICEDTDYVTSLDKLLIYDFAREAIDIFKSLGYKTIIISNQSGIARGMMTEETLKEINNEITNRIKIDKIF